ncbi:MAG: glyoxalase/bleomycin resistance/dioxygenase family protein [Proteobacteria bacterium]|uniref:ArsI/CadI family heavy metal resistance metalloenzyme n=1 Tax=Aquabacterium sp. TaxID=1872578 RepID=UPI0035C734A4|nr:glyoxalase/bleomycin resistance/dioxygenase family protein [Pseudomonadota bacterium]
MKRFHVHVHVTDLAANIAFYAKLFGAEPARVEADYAKWMLDDPAVNFAISTRGGGHTGLDHLGIQVDNAADLQALKQRAEGADLALLDEGATTCCYARSDKHWVLDPQGLPWEHFQTLDTIPVFREAADTAAAASHTPAQAPACCAPSAPSAPVVPAGKPVGIPIKSGGSGCC